MQNSEVAFNPKSIQSFFDELLNIFAWLKYYAINMQIFTYTFLLL